MVGSSDSYNNILRPWGSTGYPQWRGSWEVEIDVRKVIFAFYLRSDSDGISIRFGWWRAEVVKHLGDGLAQKDEEITEILQEMAVLVAKEDTTLRDTTNICSNSDKTIEEVSPRQARRKMKNITTFSKQALWFAESFGLVPDCANA